MKYLRLLALLCAALLLTACVPARRSAAPTAPAAVQEEPAESPSQPAKRKYVVGISWQGPTRYVQRLENCIKAEFRDADYDIELLIMDSQNNYEKQISQVESFIAYKVDVILLNPTTYFNLGPAVKAAEEAGIPLITIITRVKEQERCTSHVGSDHRQSAILQGQMVSSAVDGPVRVAILEGTVGIDAQLARSAGYAAFMEENPRFEPVASQPAYWEPDEAYMIVENWLNSGLEFDVIMAQSDAMAMGALEAVWDAGAQERVMVFGIDGDGDALQAVREGKLAGTVFMDAYSQAHQIMLCIDLLRAGEPVREEYLVPFIVVHSDNVDDPTIAPRLRK